MFPCYRLQELVVTWGRGRDCDSCCNTDHTECSNRRLIWNRGQSWAQGHSWDQGWSWGQGQSRSQGQFRGQSWVKVSPGVRVCPGVSEWVWVISKFNGTSTPKGSYSTKTCVKLPYESKLESTRKERYSQMSAKSKPKCQVTSWKKVQQWTR